ncbi:MAG: hypothetical protein AB9897_01280 [Anaerolineaceae bacterium]
MKLIGVNERIGRVEGRVKICAFEAGLIPYLMVRHELTLNGAIAMAMGMNAAKYVHKMHNLTTNVGRQFIARRISGQETAGLKYLAIGTGTAAPSALDTQLGSESLRKVLTECYQGDNFIYSSIFLLASECSFYLKEGGLFGGAAAVATANSGTLLCRFAIDEDNTTAQDDLTIQHTGEMLP